MASQFLTCKFKLHRPSARKRAVLMHTLEQYTLAYDELLRWAQEHEDNLRTNGLFREKYNAKTIEKLLPKPTAELHSSMIDSLKQDAAMTLASYLALDGGFPVTRTFLDYEIDNALDYFVQTGIEDFEEAQSFMLRRTHVDYMPLSFCRANGATNNRNFSLVIDTERPRLFAALWLLPAKHKLCQALGTQEGNLVRIDTHEPLHSNSQTAILVPLEVGANGWQKHKFLDPSYNGHVSIKTAKLMLQDGEFYLAVSFEFPTVEKYKPETYLGVDKGILFTAAYALVDKQGAMLEMGHLEDQLRDLQQKHGQEREVKARNGEVVTRRDYKTKAYDNILHSIANTLIEKALAERAMIVLEDLNIQVKGSRVVSRFRKFDNILRYKGNLVGVPVRSVFAAYSSIICHKCGGDMERNDRVVVCTQCGHTDHSDDNAGVNIARRALYRKADWPGGYREFHRSFAR